MEEKNSDRIPLINPPPSTATDGTASKLQTIGNIIVSIVGTGVLGLPFAFRIAGWLAGSIGVILAGLATYYCMLLLVSINSFLLLYCLVCVLVKMVFISCKMFSGNMNFIVLRTFCLDIWLISLGERYLVPKRKEVMFSLGYLVNFSWG